MAAKSIEGTCKYMCPEKERKMRESQRLLHQFEILAGTEKFAYPKADVERTVKKYSRSAAGRKQPEPSDLRTPEALKRTAIYLLREIVTVPHPDWTVAYNFVFDGLCSVRQDIVIQNLEENCVLEIFGPIVRFHAYSGYRLCEEPLEKYDPVINFQHFTDCLKKLLSLYEYCESKESQVRLRCEMEAMYQIAFLGKPEALIRGYELDKKFRTSEVNMAIEMSLEWYMRNYVRVCRLLRKLPLLLQCVAALHLPEIRRNALSIMNNAFSGHNLPYPLSAIQSSLIFESEDTVIDECKYYGITNQDENIIFKRNIFEKNINLRPPKRLSFIDESLTRTKLSDLLLTGALSECIR